MLILIRTNILDTVEFDRTGAYLLPDGSFGRNVVLWSRHELVCSC